MRVLPHVNGESRLKDLRYLTCESGAFILLDTPPRARFET
jgi:hypothetical protein